MRAPIRSAPRLRAALLALALGAACSAPRAPSPGVAAAPARPYLVLLGIAQDAGLPQLACTCTRCAAARADPARRRHAASALLVDPGSGRRWLFDATPDLREQLELARGHLGPPAGAPGRPPLFDGIFLTHAHVGHYAGLLHLGREAYASEETTVHASARLGAFLRANGPWSLLFEAGHLRHALLEPGRPLALAPGLELRALAVPHRGEFSDTLAFRIDGPARALLYLPDIDAWEGWAPGLEAALAGVDVALIDGTFFDAGELGGRSLEGIPHPSIASTLARLAPLPRAEREKVHFFHLNHSNPALERGSAARAAIEASGAHVAEEGQRFEL